MKPRYFIFLCWAWILCLWLKMAFYTDLEREREKEIFIPPGTSITGTTRILREETATSPYLFRLFLFLSRTDKVIAGRYLIAPGSSIREITRKLASGPLQEKVTFPEGLTSLQMASILEEKGLCKGEEYLALLSCPGIFKREWLKNVTHLEGFLFPDTYKFTLPSSPYEIIETQLKRFEELVLPLYEKSTTSLSLPEVVILASIVEKEASGRDEKPYVASVFLNRLKKGMKLQSCATVVYAHYRESGIHLHSLSTEDLQIDSPFNTYRYKGLPPQAIGNPGLDAIRAILYPKDTDYLYFVLQENGRHAFSITYDEHLDKKGGSHEKSKE
jgi:UPF0755 protein